MLAATTTLPFDWSRAAATLTRAGVEVVALRADDHGKNLDELRLQEGDAGMSAPRLAAWNTLLQQDPETQQLRAVARQLGEWLATGSVQDPRLLEVSSIIAAEAAFWRAAAPAPTTEVLATRGAAQTLLGSRRWLVARAAFDHVRTICRDVGAHATTIAARARDRTIAGRYRELALRCAEAVAAIDAAFAH